jgi:hypothetical protein
MNRGYVCSTVFAKPCRSELVVLLLFLISFLSGSFRGSITHSPVWSYSVQYPWRIAIKAELEWILRFFSESYLEFMPQHFPVVTSSALVPKGIPWPSWNFQALRPISFLWQGTLVRLFGNKSTSIPCSSLLIRRYWIQYWMKPVRQASINERIKIYLCSFNTRINVGQVLEVFPLEDGRTTETCSGYFE